MKKKSLKKNLHKSEYPKYGVVVNYDVCYSSLGQPIKIIGRLDSEGKEFFYYHLENSFCDLIRSDAVKPISEESYFFLLHYQRFTVDDFRRLYKLYVEKDNTTLAHEEVNNFIKWLEYRTEKFYDHILNHVLK